MLRGFLRVSGVAEAQVEPDDLAVAGAETLRLKSCNSVSGLGLAASAEVDFGAAPCKALDACVAYTGAVVF